MWRRCLGAVIVLWAAASVAYLSWCQHRAYLCHNDRAWPRPWPYPDVWLSRWYDRIEAENPSPGGCIKPEPAWHVLQDRVRDWNVTAFALLAVGAAVLLWPPDSQSHRWSSIRRGVLLGLAVGANWAALTGHLDDQLSPSLWLSLTTHALGFALAGALVGGVRRCPELVGLSAALFAVLVFAGASDFHFHESIARIEYECESWNLLRDTLGVEWDRAWVVLVGGAGLLCGPVIGLLHRLCNPPAVAKPDSEEDLIYG